MRTVVTLLLIIYMPFYGFAKAAGYDEHNLPPIKFNGRVKVVITKTYQVVGRADTFGNGHPFDYVETAKFDSAGRLMEVISKSANYRNDRDKGCIDKVTYHYYGNDSLMIYKYYGKWPAKKSTNRLVSRWLKTVFTYKNDKLIQRDFYVHNRVLLGRVSNFYDSKGYLVKQYHYGQYNMNAEDTSYFVNDPAGNHTLLLLTGPEGIKLKQAACTYDKNGNLTSAIDDSRRHVFQYTFDKNGNWIKMVKYYGAPADGYMENIIVRTIQYY